MYYDSVHFVHSSREYVLEEVVVDSAACVVRPQELAQNGRDSALHVRTRRLVERARLLPSACAVLFRLRARPVPMLLWLLFANMLARIVLPL